MKTKIIAFYSLTFLLTSCFLDPKKIDEEKKVESTEKVFGEKVEKSELAAKNFLQINNTYSTLTGVSTGEVATEYENLKMQLPSTSNPESLNGFNQIASTRLGFLYCDKYIDKRDDLVKASNAEAARNLIEGFVDVDIDNNEDHQALYQNVMAIMNDDDELINDGNATGKKTKLLKLSCTAILASSHVTLL